jgi:hypothetical protein
MEQTEGNFSAQVNVQDSCVCTSGYVCTFHALLVCASEVLLNFTSYSVTTYTILYPLYSSQTAWRGPSLSTELIVPHFSPHLGRVALHYCSPVLSQVVIFAHCEAYCFNFNAFITVFFMYCRRSIAVGCHFYNWMNFLKLVIFFFFNGRTKSGIGLTIFNHVYFPYISECEGDYECKCRGPFFVSWVWTTEGEHNNTVKCYYKSSAEMHNL